MLIVDPDFNRTIDLPGVGPCPRPVDIDQGVSGFADLVSLRVYSFPSGVTIDGEAEDDELFIVLMRGQVDVAVNVASQQIGAFALDEAGGLQAIYMPPCSAYRLTAHSPSDVAYARVKPPRSELADVAGFTAANGRLEVANHAAGMAMTLVVLAPGDEFALSGPGGNAPERFVHIRSETGRAKIAGRDLIDWQTAALDRGEIAAVSVQAGPVQILAVAATRR